MTRSGRTPTAEVAPAGAADPRPQRADAVKNRQRILEAADAIFATQGVAVPVDEVAARAGVGVGTMYRHFPTKEALFEAIVLTKLTDLLAAAHACAASPDPGEALFGFLHQMAEHASMKRDLFDALQAAGIDIKSQCSAMIGDLEQALERLRQRAAAQGSVRNDVSVKEIMGLVIGAVMASEQAGLASSCDQMVDIVCDGLRPRDAG